MVSTLIMVRKSRNNKTDRLTLVPRTLDTAGSKVSGDRWLDEPIFS
jgi:hypothetical protein